MAFEYEIKYTAGELIPHVDALTRIRFAKTVEDDDDERVIAAVEDFDKTTLDIETVRRELQ